MYVYAFETHIYNMYILESETIYIYYSITAICFQKYVYVDEHIFYFQYMGIT